jgi:hypothetical protein
MNATTHDKERWTSDGLYYEYSKAANPIAAGYITPIPLADFPHRLHEEGPTRIIAFDLSQELKCPGPATSPALCANFIRIRAGEDIATKPNATSELYHVIRGRVDHGFRVERSRGERVTSWSCRPARWRTKPRTTRRSTGSTTSHS